jgi:hypothetical protein
VTFLMILSLDNRVSLMISSSANGSFLMLMVFALMILAVKNPVVFADITMRTKVMKKPFEGVDLSGKGMDGFRQVMMMMMMMMMMR